MLEPTEEEALVSGLTARPALLSAGSIDLVDECGIVVARIQIGLTGVGVPGRDAVAAVTGIKNRLARLWAQGDGWKTF